MGRSLDAGNMISTAANWIENQVYLIDFYQSDDGEITAGNAAWFDQTDKFAGFRIVKDVISIMAGCG